MKKTITTLVLFVSFALLSASPAFASATWAELVGELEKKEMVRGAGNEILAEMKKAAPQGSELELWNSLWVGDAKARALAGVALMDKVFPAGDPGRWEEAHGFLSNTGYKPRQLAGLDAFFVTIAALDTIPGAEWAAAALMQSFSKSARGMIYFVEKLPQGLQDPINSIVAKTGLRDNWIAKTAGRQLPLTPVFRGTISQNTAESRRLPYLDGAGRIAGNGFYAWDRDRGYLYRVSADSDTFLSLIP